MRFQWTWFFFALFFLLMFFLHGCAGRTTDAETTKLIEASDAVCLAEATGGSTSYDQKTVMALTVREDYLDLLKNTCLPRRGYRRKIFLICCIRNRLRAYIGKNYEYCCTYRHNKNIPERNFVH